MDIVDIMLARAMTPQGKTETYLAKAAAAAAKAEKAEQDAAAAITTVETAADEIATAKSEANDLLATAQETLATAQEAQINMPEVYTTTGQNTDGYMTQKAVTDALATKADSSTLNIYVTTNEMNTALAAKADTSDLAAKADKTYVDQAIAAIPSSGSGGDTNLGTDSAGHLVVIGDDGNIAPSDTTEDSLIEALIRSGIYQAKQAVGLDINYQEKSFIRTQEAASLESGSDFDTYPMYGGRMRCNVADNGVITAFYGDSNYKEDGTNGQVMVYQPKFYYQRFPLKVDNAAKGQIIRRESILISAVEQSGFKLHPLFDAGDGASYDYVLLPAYEGTVISNKLYSIAGFQPSTNITIETAESYANVRGDGWHIMNMQAISANQMLEMIEFGSMNGQTSLEDGISNLPLTANVNCSAITGSTSTLGNATGHAESTISKNDGTDVTNTTAGTRAITYRGMENPWGNVWQMIGDIIVKGDGASQGGQPHILNHSTNEYEYVGFNLPAIYGWISAMGYGDAKYDWVLLPIECASTANSLLPVGDNLWTVSGVSEDKIIAVGGTYEYKESDGPFYYAADRNIAESARHNYGARLMYIPTKNSIYTANINKWQQHIGG